MVKPQPDKLVCRMFDNDFLGPSLISSKRNCHPSPFPFLYSWKVNLHEIIYPYNPYTLIWLATFLVFPTKNLSGPGLGFPWTAWCEYWTSRSGPSSTVSWAPWWAGTQWKIDVRPGCAAGGLNPYEKACFLWAATTYNLVCKYQGGDAWIKVSLGHWNIHINLIISKYEW